jgi:hypothetical protein
MANGVGGTYTYDDAANREDLLDIINNLDYKEFQLTSGLSTGTADNILHQWLKDTLKTPGVNAYVEGTDASYQDRTDPTRLTNWTQIVRIPFSVSDTERRVVSAGFNDRYTYESTKAMKEWKQDLEFAVLRGSMACGTGSAARQMKGIKNWVTNSTSQSGTSLTETMLNDYLQAVWEDGTQVNAIYAPIYLKRKISGFTAGANKNVNADDKRLTLAVDVYQADAASMVKLFKHRFMAGQAGDINYDLLGINEEFFRIDYLRKPSVRELAKTGDATNGEIVGEATVAALHNDAGFLTQRLL